MPSTALNAPIRVVIVDDHPLIRNGLAGMLELESDLIKVGEASSGEEAVARMAEWQPDVVLMDHVMGALTGLAAIGQLSPQMPATKFIVLTSLVERDVVQQAIQAGAHGFLLKTASPHELVAAIRNAHAGRRVLDAHATDAIFSAPKGPAPGADLTPRERELLRLLAQGLSNTAIAEQLAIGMPTVKFHVTNIFGKLGVENRVDAVLAAIKLKLVPPPR